MSGSNGHHIGSAANRWKRVEDIHGYGCGYINNIGEKIAQNENHRHEHKIQKLETLKEYALDFRKVAAESDLRFNLMTKLSNLMEENIDLDVSKLREEFSLGVEKIRAEVDAIQADDHQDFSAVNKLLRAARPADADDDDVQEDIVASQPRQLRCPILNSALVNPHKNMKCNHVYSLQGVLEYLFQKNRTSSTRLPKSLQDVPEAWKCECPVAGCKRSVEAVSLKRDYEAELTQRQIQSSEKREALDVDDVPC